jgi:hypothetical protein
MNRSQRAAILFACLVLLLSLSACSQDSASANQLDVTMTLATGQAPGYLSVSPNKTDIRVIFHQHGSELLGQQDLTSGETLTCNRTAVPLDDTQEFAFQGGVAEVAAGGTYTCVYARNGSSTQFILPAIQHLSVLSPSANVDVPYGQDLRITFTPTPGAQVSANVYSRLTDTLTTSVSGQPGATALTIPAASLAPFRGETVSVNVIMMTPLDVPAPGFRSLTATAEDVVGIPVLIG